MDLARISLESQSGEDSTEEFLVPQISATYFDQMKINLNLFRASAIRSLLWSPRPWFFVILHVVLLLSWTWRHCEEPTCVEPKFPIREAFQSFTIGFWESGPMISLCLFVLTFYCNGCINVHKEMFGLIFTTCTCLRNFAIYIHVHHRCECRRWDIMRCAARCD